MDFSTMTLFTFLLQTEPGVQSVHLLGSWDNFSNHYTMERDIRRGRDQWKGCYSFKDVACHDHAVGSYHRSGGLAMGHTYYYYFEVDGSIETHDPSVPSTTACPYLPGQTVNTLTIPTEKILRYRSASMNSMRQESFKTMDPESKFITPRPAPRTPLDIPILRLASPPARLRHKASSRSLSPAPVWKRIFSRKASNRDLNRARSPEQDDCQQEATQPRAEEHRSATPPSESSRMRDLSPDTLRRFLQSEDLPTQLGHMSMNHPTLETSQDNESGSIEDTVDDNDDDDNFATSAICEHQPYPTCLSPPPFRRSGSTGASPFINDNSSSQTLIAARTSSRRQLRDQSYVEVPGALPLPKLSTTHLRPSSNKSAPTSASTTPLSPDTPSEELLSFYDSNDDDDIISSHGDDAYLPQRAAKSPARPRAIEGYSLPRHCDEKMLDPHSALSNLPASPMLERHSANMPSDTSRLLMTPINAGLDDFASELRWVAEAIRERHH
ncbi:hypothetical protein S7711_04576 [Stachybotrys chartarum IBT 7711]|uniref:AMP-activated protein kinase glycogen-binding domain-containing protein n=1 Tax=Stachybotrys chartarum (strain CBS 109288 / IBT 7711) TaxID=1280523 RepID=A0A084APU6_STACB|nr:hypothetical protein S7711_04576 [Stachybotrys chartarum IBT 7711]